MLFQLNAILGVLLGAYVGKFIAIITHKLPKILLEENSEEEEPRDFLKWLFKKPHCKHCKHKLSLLENIPIYSYLSLRGTCRHCGNSIGLRAFLLEGTTALLFGSLMLFFPMNITLLFVLFVSCLMICCFLTDFDHGILPDQFTLTLVWIGLIGSLIPIFVTPREAIVGAVGGYGIFWLFNEIYRMFRGFDGMYPGDFKLNAGIGACLGIKWLMIVVLISFVFLILSAVIQLFSLKKSERSSILYKETPYGCYSSIVSSLMFLLMLNGYL